MIFDDSFLPLAAVLLGGGGVVGLVSAWLVYKAKSRDDTQVLIDQLQEERSEMRAQLDKERAHNEQRLDRLYEDRDDDRTYIAVLQEHIRLGNPPPPPERPPRRMYGKEQV